MKRLSLHLFDPRPAYNGDQGAAMLERHRLRTSGSFRSRHADLQYDRTLDWLFDGGWTLTLAQAMLRYLALARAQRLEGAGDVLGWALQLDMVRSEGEGPAIIWRRTSSAVTFAPLLKGCVDLRSHAPVGQAHSPARLAAAEAKRREKEGEAYRKLGVDEMTKALARIPGSVELPTTLQGLDLPPVQNVADLRDNLAGFAHALRPWRAVELQWHARKLADEFAHFEHHDDSPPELANLRF